jgi:hypothetical protein
MFVRWQKYRSVAKWHQGEPPITRTKAVLVESVRIDGKPRLKHVAFIASYDEDYRTRNEVGCRCTFWRQARDGLKQLKLTPTQRRQIEALLAKRMKPPTKREQAASDREYAALMASFARPAA